MERSIKFLFDIYSSFIALFLLPPAIFLFFSSSSCSKRANIILKRKQIFSRIIYHRLDPVFGESEAATRGNFEFD